MVFDLKSQKADVEYEKKKPGSNFSELKMQQSSLMDDKLTEKDTLDNFPRDGHRIDKAFMRRWIRLERIQP
jgi:hypothetical protein